MRCCVLPLTVHEVGFAGGPHPLQLPPGLAAAAGCRAAGHAAALRLLLLLLLGREGAARPGVRREQQLRVRDDGIGDGVVVAHLYRRRQRQRILLLHLCL